MLLRCSSIQEPRPPVTVDPRGHRALAYPGQELHRQHYLVGLLLNQILISGPGDCSVTRRLVGISRFTSKVEWKDGMAW